MHTQGEIEPPDDPARPILTTVHFDPTFLGAIKVGSMTELPPTPRLAWRMPLAVALVAERRALFERGRVDATRYLAAARW